jgi:hypothetical protein
MRLERAEKPFAIISNYDYKSYGDQQELMMSDSRNQDKVVGI